MNAIGNTFKRNTMFLTIGTVLNKGMQFMVIPLFSKWLTTSEYGQFDLLYTYVSLLIPIISFSTHEAVFRLSVNEIDIKKKKIIITAGFLIDVINYTVVFLILNSCVHSINDKINICFYIYVAVELFSTYLRGYLRAIKRLDIYSFAMLISTIVMSASVTVFVYFLEWGLMGIIVGYAMGTLIGNMVICVWTKWHTMLLFNKDSFLKIKNLIQYSIPLVPNDVSWWIMNASDRKIINMFFGASANGIYAIAHKIPAFCSVLFSMFSVSWQQEVVEKIDTKDCIDYFDFVFNKMLNVLISLCVFLLAGSSILYYYIFDERYLEAIQYSPILILSAGFMALSQFLGGIQIALRKPKQNGITTIIGATSNVLIHFSLIGTLGMYAASVSTLIANVIIFLLRALQLKKFYIISINKKSTTMIIVFGYFIVMAYINKFMILNFINIILAILIVGLLNKDYIKLL